MTEEEDYDDYDYDEDNYCCSCCGSDGMDENFCPMCCTNSGQYAPGTEECDLCQYGDECLEYASQAHRR